jgi:hypothetical protein
MPLDFGILQPMNISGGIAAGQQEAQRNQLAQQQLAAGNLQQQKAELELSDFKRRQAALDNFIKQANDNGKKGDPDSLAESYFNYAITTGDPQHVMHAQTMLQAANERKAYMASKQPSPAYQPIQATTLPPAAGAKPSFGMDDDSYKAWMADKSSNLDFKPWVDQQNAKQTNALAPAPAPAPAPVNQLTAPPPVSAPASNQIDVIRSKINELNLLYPNVPAAKAEAALLTDQLKKMETVHVVGSNLVNGAGQIIATVPKDVTLSDFERILASSGLTPQQQIQAKQDWIKKQSTHAPPISVSYGQEKAEAVDYGKLLVEGYKGIQAAANLAQKSMPAIESNLAILDKGFDTGFATETKAAGAKVLAALGVKDADKYATDAQTFLANANAAVLQRQLEQKGPQTEADAQRISATGAQLGNTKEANRFVLNVAKAQLQRDIEQRKFYSDWRATHKTFDGADDAWISGPGSKSLFDSPVLKKYSTNVVDQIPGQTRSAPAAAATVPQAAVDALKAGKGTDQQFDAIFGAGAAKRARGGK